MGWRSNNTVITQVEQDDKMKEQIFCDVAEEIRKAEFKFRAYSSSHEGYAIIHEELDELWDEVKTKSEYRSTDKMYREAMQVACTAMRFMDMIK